MILAASLWLQPGIWTVQSLGMAPEVNYGDTALAFGGTTAARGDVVRYDADPFRSLLGRVVATDGDRVSFDDGRLWVNDVALEEPYLTGDVSTWPNPGSPIEFIVGADELFVLNDERDNIMDSRAFGPITESQITGRHVLTISGGGDAQVDPVHFGVWVVTAHIPVGVSFAEAQSWPDTTTLRPRHFLWWHVCFTDRA